MTSAPAASGVETSAISIWRRCSSGRSSDGRRADHAQLDPRMERAKAPEQVRQQRDR
jgi:hypothetical protein